MTPNSIMTTQQESGTGYGQHPLQGRGGGLQGQLKRWGEEDISLGGSILLLANWRSDIQRSVLPKSLESRATSYLWPHDAGTALPLRILNLVGANN